MTTFASLSPELKSRIRLACINKIYYSFNKYITKKWRWEYNIYSDKYTIHVDNCKCFVDQYTIAYIAKIKIPSSALTTKDRKKCRIKCSYITIVE